MKFYRLQVALSLIAGFCFFSAFAQDKSTLDDRLAASRVAHEGQVNKTSNGNTASVSGLDMSGDLNLNIPLHTVRGRSLSLPLNATYKSGIKVYQKSSEIGLGWSISFGSIVRNIGAFEPDYSTTESEAKMDNISGSTTAHSDGALTNPLSNDQRPIQNHKSLIYDGVDVESEYSPLTPDIYQVNVPGLGNNSFWNNGEEESGHDFRWSEVKPWKIEHAITTYAVPQELSRINEINCSFNLATNMMHQGRNIAAAIAIPPYVTGRKFEGYEVIGANGGTISTSYGVTNVEYQDFESFTITTEDGTSYVFGRPLRTQKYLFTEDPFWSTWATDAPEDHSIAGEWWKIDYIGEWLLTEILSADYIDINSNGPDDMDKGDWIRIEYTTQWSEDEEIPGTDASAIDVPKHREWLNFTSTDRYSSIWRERAYVTKITTPVQELDFSISQKFDVDHDYFKFPLNNPLNSNPYLYSSIKPYNSSSTTEFMINYPIELMRYDNIEIRDRNLTDQTVVRNDLHTTITFNYAVKGSSQELAVSNYLIRNNSNVETVAYNPTYITPPPPESSTGIDIEDYYVSTGRGKLTLLGITFSHHDEFGNASPENRSYSFEYGFNPSFSDIHRFEILKMNAYPTLRQSAINTALPRLLPSNDLAPAISIRPFKMFQFYGQDPYDTYINTPMMDELGYYFNDEETIDGRHAWSLSKITYPGGGTESIEYEKDLCDLDADREAWNYLGGITDGRMPFIEHYNNVAIARSMAQDWWNHENVNTQKPLYRTFIMQMNEESGGVRVKKIFSNDFVSDPVERVYSYGSGHYPYVPGDFLENLTSAFSEFMTLERIRQEDISAYADIYLSYLEFNDYPRVPDFERYMSRLSINMRMDHNVNNEHYYETITEQVINPAGYDSRTIKYYGDPSNPSELPYKKLVNFFLKGMDRDYRPVVEGLVVNENHAKSPELIKVEYKQGGSGSVYTTIKSVSYDRTISEVATSENLIKEKDLESTEYLLYYYFDNSLDEGLSSVSCEAPSQFVLSQALEQWDYSGFHSAQAAIDAWEASQIYDEFSEHCSVTDDLYEIPSRVIKRLQSTKTTDRETIVQEGAVSTTQTSYFNDLGLLKKTCTEGSTITENSVNQTRYDCQYIEYGYENTGLYHSSANWLLNNWRVGLTSEVRQSSQNSSYTSTLPTSGIISSAATDYDYITTTQTVVRPVANYHYDGTLGTDGTYSSTSTFNYSTPASPWQYRSRSLEYDRYGHPVFGESDELFTRSVPGYNSSLFKASITHPREWFDATYTGYEDHFYDWGEAETGDEYEQEYWYDKNVVRGSGANPSVVKISFPTGDRKRTGRYSFKLMRKTSSGSPVQSTPVRFVKVLPHSGSVSCEEYNGELDDYDELEEPTVDCRFDYTASAWITRGLPEAESSSQFGSMTLPHVNPSGDPTGINLYTTLADGGLTSLQKYNALTPYFPLSDLVLLECLKPASSLSAAHIVNILNAQTRLSDQVLLDFWDKRTSFSQAQWLDVLVKDEQYPNDDLLLSILADNDPGNTGFMEDLLETSPYPISGKVSIAADDIGLTLPDGETINDLKWVYKVWNSSLTTVLYHGSKPILDVNNDWQYYELDIPIQKTPNVIYLEVYITDERAPYSSTAYSGGGSSYNAYNSYLSNISTYIDDMIIYPMGGKYEYYSFDWKGNTINHTNQNDDHNIATYDRFGRPVWQYNFDLDPVAFNSYKQSTNLSTAHHRTETRVYANNMEYANTISYLDGFYMPIQTWHQKSQQFGYYVIDQDCDVYKRTTWLSKPFAVNQSWLPNKAISNSGTHLTTQYGFSDPGSESVYEHAFSGNEGEFYAPVLQSESAIFTEFDKLTTAIGNPTYTNNGGVTKSFPQYQLWITKSVDAEGATSYEYRDKFGNLVAQSPTDVNVYSFQADGDISWGSPSSLGLTYFDHDKANRLREVKDRRGLRTLYTYDARGNITQEVHPDKGTSQYRYDKLGRLRFSKDNSDQSANLPGGISERYTYYKYDDWNRLAEVGTVEHTSGTTHFDNSTNIDDQGFPGPSQTRRKVYVVYEYDESKATNTIGKMSKTTSYSGHTLNGSSMYIPASADVVSYEYDNNGNVSKTSYLYEEFSNPHMFTYTHDLQGNVLTTSYEHPTDADFNYTETLDYNGVGQLVEARSEVGSGAVKTDGVMTYDIYGHLVSRKLSKQSNGSFAESVFYTTGIREQMLTQSGSKFYNRLFYDKNGRISEHRWLNDHFDNMGSLPTFFHRYDYFYDKTSRLVGANYIEQNTQQSVNGGYGTRLAANPDGNPFSCGYLSSALQGGEYDDLNNDRSIYLGLLDENEQYFGYDAALASEYGSIIDDAIAVMADLDSRKSGTGSVLVPLTHTQQSSLGDALNLVTADAEAASEMLLPFVQTMENSGLNDSEKLAEWTGSLLVLDNTAMATAWPVTFRTAVQFRAALTLIFADGEATDAQKVTAITSAVNDLLESNIASLDLFLDHLEGFSELNMHCNNVQGVDGYADFDPDPVPLSAPANRKWDTEYYYDQLGNIAELKRYDNLTVKTEYDFSYSSTTNFKTGSQRDIGGTVTGGSFAYDANGNMRSASHLNISSITYSEFDMPITTQMAGGSTNSYRYADLSTRSVKVKAGGAKEYYIGPVVLDNNQEPTHISMATGFVTFNPSTGNAERYYTCGDWLGTVRTTMDETGAVTATRDHYPYGKVMPGRNYTSDSEDRRFQFTGHEYDEETDLDYHGARYYSREFGQYLGVDPLRMNFTAWNSYNYALGNPVFFVDPDGRSAVCPTCPEDAKYDVFRNADQEFVYNVDGSVSPEKNPYDASKSGFIQAASEIDYESSVFRGLARDATYVAAQFFGLDAVDTAIDQWLDPSVSTTEAMASTAEAMVAVGSNGKGATKGGIRSFDDIATNPKALWGKSADEVAELLGEGWTKGAYGSKDTGWKFTKGDQSVFYHPGGGWHGGPYYGFSSGKLGKNKIVDDDYVPISGDKATIIKK